MIKKYSFYLLFFCLIVKLNAQGCSDAGVCTAGSLHIVGDNTKDSTQSKLTAGITLSAGIGEQKSLVTAFQPEINLIVNSKLSFQAKIPYMAISGKTATVSGLGDVTLAGNYNFNNNFTITLGTKLPTNNANIIDKGLALPMSYQTSLGTFDALIGLKYIVKKWEFIVGYQQVLVNNNQNQYLHLPILTPVDSVTYNANFESNKLERAPDAVFRVARNFEFDALTFTPGVLFIYHLFDDKITNAQGQVVDVKGSQGLTINLNAAANIKLSNTINCVVSLAAPILVRKTRTDGLTRSAIVSAGFFYSF